MDITTPANEPGRFEALKNYAIVDTLPETEFDEIAELAAQICDCPAALVSFIDASRQWIKAKYGPPGRAFGMSEGNFGLSRSRSATTTSSTFPTFLSDQRFNTSPLVTGGLRLRFYCGVPLITQDGHALGSLCVVDFKPRELSFEQQEH